jgi:hypothetical protein
MINITDRNGNEQPCIDLLNFCSEAHFPVEKMCKRLGLNTQEIDVPLRGTNQMTSEINQMTRAQIQSRTRNYTAELTFLITNEMSSLENINRDNLKISHDTLFADPTFDRSSDVDGLFGAHLFWMLVRIDKISLEDKEIQLHNTQVGWIVTVKTVGNSQQCKAIRNAVLKALLDDIKIFTNTDIEECSSTRFFL